MALFVSSSVTLTRSINVVYLDTAEILETRTVDGTDQQEYFVHYLNCKYKKLLDGYDLFICFS